MPKLFISYRRHDAGIAGRVYDRLSPMFGRGAVFMDVDSIEPGAHFPDMLKQRLRSCDAVLVVISREWLELRGPAGLRRLDDPADFVRIEILEAITLGLNIIPILVGGATMPTARELSTDLAELADRQAIEVRDTQFHRDMDRLIVFLKESSRAKRSSTTISPAGELARELGVALSGSVLAWLVYSYGALICALVTIQLYFQVMPSVWVFVLPTSFIFGIVCFQCHYRLGIALYWVIIPLFSAIGNAQLFMFLDSDFGEDEFALFVLFPAIIAGLLAISVAAGYKFRHSAYWFVRIPNVYVFRSQPRLLALVVCCAAMIAFLSPLWQGAVEFGDSALEIGRGQLWPFIAACWPLASLAGAILGLLCVGRTSWPAVVFGWIYVPCALLLCSTYFTFYGSVICATVAAGLAVWSIISIGVASDLLEPVASPLFGSSLALQCVISLAIAAAWFGYVMTNGYGFLCGLRALALCLPVIGSRNFAFGRQVGSTSVAALGLLGVLTMLILIGTSVSVRVTDATGAGLSGASVRLAESVRETDERGYVEFPLLPPGPHVIAASVDGFIPLRYHTSILTSTMLASKRTLALEFGRSSTPVLVEGSVSWGVYILILTVVAIQCLIAFRALSGMR